MQSYMGGLGLGVWTLAELSSLQADPRIYHPRMSLEERDRMLGGWKEAVGRLIARK